MSCSQRFYIDDRVRQWYYLKERWHNLSITISDYYAQTSTAFLLKRSTIEFYFKHEVNGGIQAAWDCRGRLLSGLIERERESRSCRRSLANCSSWFNGTTGLSNLRFLRRFQTAQIIEINSSKFISSVKTKPSMSMKLALYFSVLWFQVGVEF